MEDIKYPVKITMTKAGKIYGIDFKPEVLKKFVNSEYGYMPVNFSNIPIYEYNYNPQLSSCVTNVNEDVSIKLSTKLESEDPKVLNIGFEVSFGNIKQDCNGKCSLIEINHSITKLQDYIFVLNKDRGDLGIKEDYDDPEVAADTESINGQYLKVDNKLLEEASDIFTEEELDLVEENLIEFTSRMYNMRLSHLIDKKRAFLDSLKISE